MQFPMKCCRVFDKSERSQRIPSRTWSRSQRRSLPICTVEYRPSPTTWWVRGKRIKSTNHRLQNSVLLVSWKLNRPDTLQFSTTRNFGSKCRESPKVIQLIHSADFHAHSDDLIELKRNAGNFRDNNLQRAPAYSTKVRELCTRENQPKARQSRRGFEGAERREARKVDNVASTRVLSQS